MPYTLFIKPFAIKESEKIPKKQKEQIRREIELLQNNSRPFGVKKLKGQEDFFRIRIGNYRVLYTINEKYKEIRILSILDRKEAYR